MVLRLRRLPHSFFNLLGDGLRDMIDPRRRT
jgi:ABC-type dipeptide/oligopeptide/nickel transport system permease subunit